MQYLSHQHRGEHVAGTGKTDRDLLKGQEEILVPPVVEAQHRVSAVYQRTGDDYGLGADLPQLYDRAFASSLDIPSF